MNLSTKRKFLSERIHFKYHCMYKGARIIAGSLLKRYPNEDVDEIPIDVVNLDLIVPYGGWEQVEKDNSYMEKIKAETPDINYLTTSDLYFERLA